MIDRFGRRITYLRLSVTDRCNLRCTYCMPKQMRFAARPDLLTIGELGQVAEAFVRVGVRKIRLTGGEPLVRPGILDLTGRLSRLVAAGLIDEVTLTTNGTRLAEHARSLATLGIRRINVSLDTLDAERFEKLTQGGRLAQVVEGIDAALDAGIAVKLNAVALAETLDEAPGMMSWAHARGAAITFIEVMPLGKVEQDRRDQHVPMSKVRSRLERQVSLHDTPLSTGGPARYARTPSGDLVGFITPLTHNFCSGCNRVRVTATGELFPCLGDMNRTGLRSVLRQSSGTHLDQAIAAAIAGKPLAHDFAISAERTRGPARHMSVTGG